jgi:hypothetical protein
MSNLPGIPTFQLSGNCVAPYSVNPPWNADKPICLKSASLLRRPLKSFGQSRKKDMKFKALGLRQGMDPLERTHGIFFMSRGETPRCVLKNYNSTWAITAPFGRNTMIEERFLTRIGMGASVITKTTIESKIISIQKSSSKKTASFSVSTNSADAKYIHRNANDE